MSRTPISDSLIHNPDEVARNAERFDNLCHLVDEVAFPIVRDAMIREVATFGAEVLTEEAKFAFETTAEEAAVAEGLEDVALFENLRSKLDETIPPPDDAESKGHTRDLSQFLMGAWLENLRHLQLKPGIVILSDYLIPKSYSVELPWYKKLLGATPQLPKTLRDAIVSFAINEDEALQILSALRTNLFAEERLVDLPFGLVIVGAPAGVVLVMTRSLCDRLLKEIDIYLHKIDTPNHLDLGRSLPKNVRFETPRSRVAFESISEQLFPARYECLTKVALPGLTVENIERGVQRVLEATQ